MMTGHTGRALRLTLSLGGLLIAAAASASDVQSQAREILIGHGPANIAASEATPRAVVSRNRVALDAQRQAASVIGGVPPAAGDAPSIRLALGAEGAPQSGFHRRLSGQEMARRVVLGIGE